jgi:hypothetical protein
VSKLYVRDVERDEPILCYDRGWDTRAGDNDDAKKVLKAISTKYN